jgi:hypothetical protein
MMNLLLDSNEEYHDGPFRQPSSVERSSPRPARGRHTMEGALAFSGEFESERLKKGAGSTGGADKADRSGAVGATRARPKRSKSSTRSGQQRHMEDISTKSAAAALPSSTRRPRSIEGKSTQSPKMSSSSSRAATETHSQGRSGSTQERLHSSLPAMSSEHAAKPKRTRRSTHQTCTSKPSAARKPSKSPPRPSNKQQKPQRISRIATDPSPAASANAPEKQQKQPPLRRMATEPNATSTPIANAPDKQQKLRPLRQLATDPIPAVASNASEPRRRVSDGIATRAMANSDDITPRTKRKQRVQARNKERTKAKLQQSLSSIQDSSTRFSLASLPTNLGLYAQEKQNDVWAARAAKQHADHEKEKWWKQWGRLSLSGQAFLETGGSGQLMWSRNKTANTSQSGIEFLNSSAKSSDGDGDGHGHGHGHGDEEFRKNKNLVASLQRSHQDKRKEADDLLRFSVTSVGPNVLPTQKDDGNDVDDDEHVPIRKVKSESSVVSKASSTKPKKKLMSDRSSLSQQSRSKRKPKPDKKKSHPTAKDGDSDVPSLTAMKKASDSAKTKEASNNDKVKKSFHQMTPTDTADNQDLVKQSGPQSIDANDAIVSVPPLGAVFGSTVQLKSSDPKPRKATSSLTAFARGKKKQVDETTKTDKEDGDEANREGPQPSMQPGVFASPVEVMPATKTGEPRRRTSRPVNELSAFLNQYDDLDALFSRGIEEAVAMESSSNNLQRGSHGPPSTAEGAMAEAGISPVSRASNKLPKVKSRATDVLKRFMKNFDELDILFSRKVIKPSGIGSGDEKHNHSWSSESYKKRKESKPKLTGSSAHETTSGQKLLLSDAYERRSLPDVLANTQESGSHGTARQRPSNVPNSNPNFLKKMLEMSNADLEALFADKKHAAVAIEAGRFEIGDVAASEEPSRDSLTRHTMLSRVSEEPSSLANCKISESTPKDLEAKAPNSRTAGARASLTLEDLVTPELEDSTDEESHPISRNARLIHSQSDRTHDVRSKSPGVALTSKSDRTHEVRRKSSHEAIRRAPIRRRVERSLSPHPRPHPRLDQLPKTGTTKHATDEQEEKPTGRSLQTRRGKSASSLSEQSLTRSWSPRPRQEIITQGFSPPKANKEARGRRSLPSRLTHGERSLSPARRAGQVSYGAYGHSDIQTSRQSLPTRLSHEDELPSSPERSSSQPVDVLQTLLDRYIDHEELYSSGLLEATAPLTMTELLDIDYQAVETMATAERALERTQAAAGDEPERTKKLEANRAAARVVAGHRDRTVDAGRRGSRDMSPKSPRLVPTKGTGVIDISPKSPKRVPKGATRPGSRYSRDKSPARPLHLAAVDPKQSDTTDTAEEPANALDHPEQTNFKVDENRTHGEEQVSFGESPPVRAVLVTKEGTAEDNTHKAAGFVYIREEALDMERVDPAFISGGLGLDHLESAEVSRNSLDDFMAREIQEHLRSRNPASQRDDGHLSLPTFFCEPDQSRGSNKINFWSASRYGPDEAFGFPPDDVSWQHYDQPRSAYARAKQQNAELRGSAYADRKDRGSHRHGSPWVDHQYCEDVYYSHPNLGLGMSIHDSFPKVHELEAQRYAQSHPHLGFGRSFRAVIQSSPNLRSDDRGYMLEASHGQYEDPGVSRNGRSNSMRGSEPFRPRGPSRDQDSSRFDAGRSMCLDDVFGRSSHHAATWHGRLHKTDHSRRSAVHMDEGTRSSSERRLSTSLFGNEMEWQDFTEVARSGALQSIPWRNIRGLSFQQHLRQVEEARCISSLMLDETFHWRYQHAVSKGCSKSHNEFCCSAGCCCNNRCSPPLYHHPAQSLTLNNKKEQDAEPSHRGRTVRGLATIAASSHIENPAHDDDGSSLLYPPYDPKLDERLSRQLSGDGTLSGDEDTLLSFAL